MQQTLAHLVLLIGRSPSRRDERGANLVEYALLIALIAIVCIGAVTFLGSILPDRFNAPRSALDS